MSILWNWTGTAAAGLGRVYGRVSDGEVPRVVYNKRLFNEDSAFYMPDMVFTPKPENCLTCHASPGSFGSWPVLLSLALVLGLAHLLMTREVGILISVQKIVMDHSAFLGPFLILVAALGYVWLVRKSALNRALSTGLYNLGILTAGTGLFLWIGPFSDSTILLFALGIHVILAGVMVLASVALTFMERRCMGSTKHRDNSE